MESNNSQNKKDEQNTVHNKNASFEQLQLKETFKTSFQMLEQMMVRSPNEDIKKIHATILEALIQKKTLSNVPETMKAYKETSELYLDSPENKFNTVGKIIMNVMVEFMYFLGKDYDNYDATFDDVEHMLDFANDDEYNAIQKCRKLMQDYYS